MSSIQGNVVLDENGEIICVIFGLEDPYYNKPHIYIPFKSSNDITPNLSFKKSFKNPLKTL